ncbi:MAG: NAD(P)/FAD-dependent oxidoreductase [Chitinophagales bacterium]|nr:NAD(P)/FAD-dependent oxidoreductase [Chitinophagales bacterium]
MKVDYQVGIIGAGFAGLVAALRLKKEGKNSFVIFERASEPGGTWRDNTYPGCACDVPSHLYSIADELNPDWSYSFSTQPEIWAYMKHVVAKHQLDRHIRYESDIVELTFMQDLGLWRVVDKNGNLTNVKLVIAATGPLNRPNKPHFKGLETFAGKVFHTAEWDHSYDLKGKKVGVVGTGASAIQVIPSIAPMVSHLTVFQRTAPWVTPRRDRRITSIEKRIFKTLPFLQKLHREGIYWSRELFGLAFMGNDRLNRFGQRMALRMIDKQVKDAELRKKLRPNFKLGCKRVLVADNYYETYNRANVSLVTEGLDHFTTTGIVTKDGKEYPLDAVILSTGFVAADIELYTTIKGLDGRNLIEEWRQKGAEAFHGITVSGYPNLAFLLGPNTGLGHNSVIHMMESQMNYIIDYLKLLESKGSSNAYLNVDEVRQKQHNNDLQEKLKHTVWASGCSSWYLNAQGKNTTLYPGLTVSYRKETRKVNPEDYHVVIPK